MPPGRVVIVVSWLVGGNVPAGSAVRARKYSSMPACATVKASITASWSLVICRSEDRREAATSTERLRMAITRKLRGRVAPRRPDHVVVGIASPVQSDRLLKKIEVFSEVVMGAALPRGASSLWPSSWNSRPRMLASVPGTAAWAVTP